MPAGASPVLIGCRDAGSLPRHVEVDEATDGLVSLIDGLGVQAMLDRRRVTPGYQLHVINAHLGVLGIR